MTTWEEKYGEHPMKTQECKNKMFNTWEEKFNGHPLHNKEVYLKWEKQMVKNFGGLSPMCDKNVREKALDSLYKNNKIPTSSQQNKIYEMLKEHYKEYEIKINYPLSTLALDVFLNIDNIKIDIEYDGEHWHLDEAKDRRRDEYVKSQGIKVLRIKGKHKIPTLEQIEEKIDFLINTDCCYTYIKIE